MMLRCINCNWVGKEEELGQGFDYKFCPICGVLVIYLREKLELNKPELDPIPNDQPAVWDLVMVDMKDRDQMGLQKYKTRLQPHNGRDFLKDTYQELLDAAVYIRGLLYERDGK